MNTRRFSKLAIILSTAVCCISCSRTSDQEKEEKADLEAQRLSEARANLQETIAAKREQAAQDLEGRSQRRLAKQTEVLAAAASEQVRREILVRDIRDSVDSLNISGERQTPDGPRYLIDGKVLKPGDLLRSTLGYAYSFESKSGDIFTFAFIDDTVDAKFKRPINGISHVMAKQLRELAPGIPAGQLDLVGQQPVPPKNPQPQFSPSVDESLPTQAIQRAYTGGNIRVIRATYGAEGRNRDVTPLVASLANAEGSIRVGNDTLGGDPYFGKVKTLTIEYTQNGRRMVRTFQEGATATLH